MPVGQFVEVVVKGKDDPVGDPPGLPRHHHDDAHATNSNDAVAVVICCRDRAELLADALPPALAALRPQDELLVVDSASCDSSVADVARRHGVRVVRCERPGLSRARNAGWRSTDRPFLLFTDDDCRLDPAAVRAAAAALQLAGTGVVWGRVVADGDDGRALSVTAAGEPAAFDGSGDLSATGHGAAMAFRREVLGALSGFDEALGAGGRFRAGEDKDAFWRAVRAGWLVRAEPRLLATHVTWRAEGEALRTLYGYGYGAGAVATKRRRVAGERDVLGELWRHGLLPAARSARRGRLGDSAGALVRAVGCVNGAWQARRTPLERDHLVDA